MNLLLDCPDGRTRLDRFFYVRKNGHKVYLFYSNRQFSSEVCLVASFDLRKPQWVTLRLGILPRIRSVKRGLRKYIGIKLTTKHGYWFLPHGVEAGTAARIETTTMQYLPPGLFEFEKKENKKTDSVQISSGYKKNWVQISW